MKLPLSKIKELALLLGKKPIEDDPKQPSQDTPPLRAVPATGTNFAIKSRPDCQKTVDGGTVALQKPTKDNYGIAQEDETRKPISYPKDNELNKAVYEKDLRRFALNTTTNIGKSNKIFKSQNSMENASVEDVQNKTQEQINKEQIQNAKDKLLIAKPNPVKPNTEDLTDAEIQKQKDDLIAWRAKNRKANPLMK